MPEEEPNGSDLERLLEHLKDYSLNVHNYRSIQNALDTEDNIRVPVVEKLLSICVRDLKEDMKNASYMLDLIAIIIKKVKGLQSCQIPDFVPSAIAVIHILKTTAFFNKVESLKALCFEIILLFPDETLIAVSVNHSNELMELFNIYCSHRIPLEIRLQPINIIIKLLKILPPDKKTTFVKEGISIWFSKIMSSHNLNTTIPQILEALELLTDELVHIDYNSNVQWMTVLECIYTPQKYPAIMKRLLETGNEHWHRLWIIFIKLLKNQITKNIHTAGSPINAMLPVVEMAFKMDITNRCRAFLCWNVLIDNFSMEVNEVYINKRIKLLIIPLTSNNAKVEETAIAKLNTWWHLMFRFYNRLDKFSEIVLIPFLHFCFGKPVMSDKPVLIPGLISKETKYQVVQAFINILGHAQCQGCVGFPKLKLKLLTTKILVSHWRDWIHALYNAIIICSENNELSGQHIKCFWKSFVMTVGELPDNNIRRDLFNEVIGILRRLTDDCNDKVAFIIFNILFVTLFDNDKTKQLLKSKDEQHAPINNIVTVVSKLPLSRLGNRHTVVQNFKPLCYFLVEEAFKTSTHSIEYVLKYIPSNGLLLWRALAESICELQKTLCPRALCKLLIMPFQNLDLFVEDKQTTLAWLNVYKSTYSAVRTTSINEDITKTIHEYNSNKSPNTFFLSVAITMLHRKIEVDNTEFITEAGFLKDTIFKMNKSLDIISILPSLTEAITLMLDNLCQNTNVAAAECAISIIALLLDLCSQISKNPINELHVYNNLQIIFKSLESVFKIKDYFKLKFVLVDILKNSSYLKKQQVIKDCILSIYKSTAEDKIECEFKKVIETFEKDDELNNDPQNVALNQSSDKVNFTTPSGKSATKKLGRKETKITNTVSDNGMEYIIVKSKWKFNPRKLTNNQKEKLQRKREDIPALYQDLSQSQDEFKLTAWKTDSQDTTTTSKSTSEPGNEDISSILKNIPSSEFVPKIIENIIGKDKVESDVKASPAKGNTKNDTNKEENKQNDNSKQLVTKDTKSPRLALKDRVFRNVRNLIEKSNLSKEGTEINPTNVENVIKTPTKSKPPANLTNSAPSLICADRPSRVKRKPKKFEDLEIFGLKKRRHSSGQNDSPTDSDIIESNSQEKNVLSEPIKELQSSKEKEEKVNEINDQEIKNAPKECIASCENVNSAEMNTDNEPKIDFICEAEISLNIDNPSVITTPEITKEDKPPTANEKISEIPCNDDNEDKNLSPSSTTSDKNKLTDTQKSSKKSGTKKSRIEKELAIDMVEGHPFLTVQSEKRLTRKAISSSPCTRKSLLEKFNKNKSETKCSSKSEKKVKEKERSISIKESQNTNTQDTLTLQDVIESSQELTVTTISPRRVGKKIPVVTSESFKMDEAPETQNLVQGIPNDNNTLNAESKDDTELPLNKTVNEKVLIDLTENMDTEPINMDDDVIIINDDEDQPSHKGRLDNKTEDKSVDQDSQNTAEADTQSLDPLIFIDQAAKENQVVNMPDTLVNNSLIENSTENMLDNDVTNASFITTPTDETKTMSESVSAALKKEDINSPFKDEEQRKKDFLNNTLEISPIKTLSPVREKKSPSPETSSDYVVIKLSSPVQSNGEPFEKIQSPEFFTEDKISPEKRDQSPPREEVSVTNTSPSSALSLKKNRPQVRSVGRAAQMLGLCVPDRLQTIITSENKSSDIEDNKKSPSTNTSARRNLRILYNSSTAETHDNSDEQDDSDNFLKLKRSLPATDCSPSGPILKRKLADITDENTASPASKRKRVSFHDPPVSTTICVKKYIEPCGVRSPQNSAIKRQERQLRSQIATKSPKRLENVFKLDSVLTKAVESFTESNISAIINEDSEISSLEQTPIAQVIKTTDLNDTDPVCPELADCKDPISNIASELSSPSMKLLLIKEFEGKINSVGDLAKMTELDINRLCIKAPKVQVVKKVLGEYLKKLKKAYEEITPTIEAALSASFVPDGKLSTKVQTNEVVVEDIAMQIDKLVVPSDGTQTDSVSTIQCREQTDESGNKITAEIVTCLSERPESVAHLCEKMNETSKKMIVDKLPFNVLTDMLINKLTTSNSDYVLNRVLEQQNKLDAANKDGTDRRLSILQDYLYEKFEAKDLVLFCSELLKKVYEKPI